MPQGVNAAPGRGGAAVPSSEVSPLCSEGKWFQQLGVQVTHFRQLPVTGRPGCLALASAGPAVRAPRATRRQAWVRASESPGGDEAKPGASKMGPSPRPASLLKAFFFSQELGGLHSQQPMFRSETRWLTHVLGRTLGGVSPPSGLRFGPYTTCSLSGMLPGDFSLSPYFNMRFIFILG